MAKQPSPSDLADKFMLRLPDGLRERLAVVAKANGRSMNREIVARIEESFSSDAAEPKLDALLRQLDAALAILKRLDANGGGKKG